MTAPAFGTNANHNQHRATDSWHVRRDENGRTVYPQRVNPSTERAPQYFEKKLAEPNPARRGPRQAEEQALQRDPSLEPTFWYGFNSDRAAAANTYDAKVASLSPLARDSDPGGPSWDRVPREAVVGFVQDRQVPGQPFQRSRDVREKSFTVYERVIAPPNGGRRYNHANVHDGGRS